ncbi:MAG: DUF5078 domain-containing protein [Mycobacterium sp.]
MTCLPWPPSITDSPQRVSPGSTPITRTSSSLVSGRTAVRYLSRRIGQTRVATCPTKPRTFRPALHAAAVLQQRGVAPHTTDICSQYPPDDQSVWNW